MNKMKSTKGITLIALVVTIIVLLILAGISIMMLTGENGILNRASESGEKTGRAQIIEIARVDIIDKQTQNGGEITEKELVEILTSDKYNTSGTLSDNGEETVLDKTLTTKDKKYEIPVREIYNGKFKKDDSLIYFTLNGKQFSFEKTKYLYNFGERFDVEDWGYSFSMWLITESPIKDKIELRYQGNQMGYSTFYVKEGNGLVVYEERNRK